MILRHVFAQLTAPLTTFVTPLVYNFMSLGLYQLLQVFLRHVVMEEDGVYQ
jgi:hypothetical protein